MSHYFITVFNFHSYAFCWERGNDAPPYCSFAGKSSTALMSEAKVLPSLLLAALILS